MFDTRRVSLSGLAAELVVAPDDKTLPAGVVASQFARTPYAVGFKAGWDTFVLSTVHIDYAARRGGRQEELQAIADWLSRWVAQEAKWDHNLIVLGDFNVDRKGDELYEALTSSGLTVAPGTEELRRSLFDGPDVAVDKRKLYDQICWFTSRDGRRAQLTMEYVRGGNFEFDRYVYRELALTNAGLQHRMSDHLPLWVELGLGGRLG